MYLKNQTRGERNLSLMKYAFRQGRKLCDTITAEKNAGLELPSRILVMRDVNYDLFHSHSNEKRVMDVYRDTAVSADQPIIIYVHGGDFFMGRKDSDAAFCVKLAQSGFVVFSVGYTLIPECNAFTQWRDLTVAMRYIENNAGVYGGDLNNVFLLGDNSGAHMVVYAIAMKGRKFLADAANANPTRLGINAVCLTRGMFQATKFDLFGLLMRKYIWGKRYKEHYTDPCHRCVAKTMPPTALITGSNDEFRRYTERFASALAECGVEYEKHIYTGDEGGYFTLFNPDTRDGEWTLDIVLNFFRSHVKAEVVDSD